MRFDPVPTRLAIRNLLVAPDFSSASLVAVKYAAAWAGSGAARRWLNLDVFGERSMKSA